MKIIILMTAIVAILSRTTQASMLVARCDEDQLGSYEAGRGRNAWAERCGWIMPPGANLNLDMMGMYTVCLDRIAPTDRDAECGDQPVVLFCKVSCFAEQEEVLFTDGYRTLLEASKMEEEPHLRVAFQIQHDPFKVLWSDEMVEMFIAGDHHGVIYKINLEDGKSLQVTRTHPMILSDATVLPAENVTLEHHLLTVDGPVKVRSIEQVESTGKVWNVQPISVEANRNVIAARGILTGSARYQNQWSDILNRLALRDQILVIKGGEMRY